MPTPIDINNVVIESSTAFAGRFDMGMSKASPDYEQIATVTKSSSGATGYGWLGDFPKLKEWIGERQLKNLEKHQYNIINKLFEDSVSIPRVDYEDNDYGRYGIIFEQMGYEAKIYPDEHVFGLLKNGFTELCYDGQPFFDADHPLDDGVSVASNIDVPETDPGEAWYLLDTSRPIKPIIWQERIKPEFQSVTNPNDYNVFTTDSFAFGTRARGNAGFSFWQLAFSSKLTLNEASFSALMDRMLAQKNSEGRPLRVRPTLLVVPVSMRAAAETLLYKKYLEGGEENPYYKRVELLVSPEL
ncbi:Mu-like prophage major head subunit gpT family protein [Vibrio parahaemolyticus]|uniref:Mu-like prophage major head subunit gpT family protein n=1 Tax=Vibrio parahaemolyticus TaxID=670 RepID=UPI002B1FCAFF|nr:Mu-like prophage major head subunit gpT family protein [Vibrio parahaemolyticus]MEA5313390.1 Mu-like prophage major head subunit gpT family protein [Vibrio parahaemolyticus]